MWVVYSDVVLTVMRNIEYKTSIINDQHLKDFILFTLEEGLRCGQAIATFDAMLALKEHRPTLGDFASDDYWTSDSAIASANKEVKEIEGRLLARIAKINTLITEEQKNLISHGIALCCKEGYRIYGKHYMGY